MLVGHGQEDLCAGGPEDDCATAFVVRHETADVTAQMLNHLTTRGTLQRVCAMQPLGPTRVKGSGHWSDGGQLVGHALQIFLAQHLGASCGFEGVIREDVPPAKDEAVQSCYGDHLFDQLLATILPAHTTHLRH